MGGVGQVIAAAKNRGHVGRVFEIEIDEVFQDFLGQLGYLEAISLVKSLRAFGLSHWDTVCSSFV